jgi:hypothetical protein
MISFRACLLTALGLGPAVACNALLDNEPRHLAELDGQGGAAHGGQRDGIAGASTEGGAKEASGAGTGGTGADSTSGGEGAAPGCDSCVLAHATSECREGACVIIGCQPGFLDSNARVGDGCEAGDVPSDALLLWLMADHGLTAPNDQVSEWIDQSSAHVTASAMTPEAMPKRVKQASGPPMVEFDGADDGLKLPEGFSTFNGTTFFAVATAYSANGCAGILSLSNGNDADDIEFGRHTTSRLYYEVLGDFVQGASNAFEANERLLVSITQSSTGAVELRINGVLNASPTTIPLPKAVVRRQNFVGRDTYTACPQAYKGLLGELILYTRGVSADEYARMQAYLAAKWSIPVASP